LVRHPVKAVEILEHALVENLASIDSRLASTLEEEVVDPYETRWTRADTPGGALLTYRVESSVNFCNVESLLQAGSEQS